MNNFPAIERRDPASGLLMLGAALAEARKLGRSGEIEVKDQGSRHVIRFLAGSIAEVVAMDASDGALPRSGPRTDSPLRERVRALFSLARPHVIWTPNEIAIASGPHVDPAAAVVDGVTRRRELFDPRKLAERIPVNTLRLDERALAETRRLPLAADEKAFLTRLARPTPVPLILWKRGLEPGHAGALVVALNLLGLWGQEWEPGFLPRVTDAVRVVRALRAGAPDHVLLRVAPDALEPEVDQAFRRLSLALHPDRLAGMPAADAALAGSAYASVSAAYDRLKRSRRKRPVVIGRVKVVRRAAPRRDDIDSLLMAARSAQGRGDLARARSFAVKALALSPLSAVRVELLAIVSRAA
ncbi:MAG: J domain-containing protein [Deltaproteobacteria bacterium]|nr:J domain-containing protein [Deltaproteobacteria bacterium]